MERARDAVAGEPFLASAMPLRVTASRAATVVVQEVEGIELSELPSAADRALCDAKQAGWNRWVLRTVGS